MRSLRIKILALAALLVVVTQAGTIATLLATANREVEQHAAGDLQTSGTVLERVLKLRADELHGALLLVVADRDLEAALRVDDQDAAARFLARYGERTAADLALILDDSGRVLGRAAGPDSLPAALPALVRRAAEAGVTRVAVSAGGSVFHVAAVATPATARHGRRWFAMGLALDDARARRIAELGGRDVAFVTGAGADTQILGSSLPGIDDAALATALAGDDRPASAVLRLAVGDREYLAVRMPLLPDNPDVHLLLLQSMDLALEPYRLLRWVAIALGIVALLIALAGASLVARAITRPIQELLRAAVRIRNGDYTRPVQVEADDELGMLATAINTMQGGIAERESRITYQARFDGLTGLPNRLLALERLTRVMDAALERNDPVSVLVVNLGMFGDVAATLGHEISDALLAQAAERLRASVDARHTVARLESDEFLVVLEGAGLEAARDLAEDLLRLLGAGLSVRDVNISTDVVVGIAACPGHGREAEQLLLRATVARNDARSAQQSIQVYQEGGEERRVRQLAILGDLRRAVRRDELKLYLQPKLSLGDGRVSGAEALVRWDHPTFGWLPPGDFIGVAEQFGNISLITRWALSAAVRECRLWVEDGLDIAVSVNISGRDLLDQDLPIFILQLLRDHDLAPRYLTLEVTEEALVHDFERATLVLQCLRDLGARVSIDDFGTGYSSLAQIRRLPVDELKIDRSFVMELPQNREDAAIVRAAIELAHSLGLELVAEGVETPAALRWLAAHGCERAQGFLISRPMPAEAFGAWVGRYRAGALAWEQYAGAAVVRAG